MIKPAAFFIGMLISAGIGRADDEAVARYRNYLPEQILAIPEVQQKNSVPMMYIGAATAAVSPAGNLITQASLNSLMYNGMSDFEGAKKEFQRDLGEEATGKLTVWQLHTLSLRVSRLNQPAVSFFPLQYGGNMVEDFASVRGTLRIIDERIAYPINHVRVDCFKRDGYCVYRQTILTLPDENSFGTSYNVTDMGDEFYKITRWENNQIDAIPSQSTACRVSQLNFNFSTNEFFEIARNNTATDCKTTLGVTLPRLEKPRISQIVDGTQIVAAEFRRINNVTKGYYSSSFRKRVADLNQAKKTSRTTND
ncbi:hypothetical protein F4695_000564 [Rhizobium soli]|uniref:Uncharacterized protein n=1 Tax=Rhizobium soli TaxID=424798 RepID=A0A7X0MRJ3_9HYPH|nr:hypothetical protein [Rhizobium soli]MBB6507245.1 hypothetical protein [Rhizobium soli]